MSIALMACSAPRQVGGEVEVDFLWVKSTSEGREHQGGISQAVLKVEKSTSGMHVGIFESKPGGTGESWRAAMWVAALTGTLDIMHNPLDYRYSVETETLAARVDGPSAGGLFAVAIMAALLNEKIDSAATMTGTINPDGTIGPVGGVAAKMQAASTKGKTRFCYPVGQRFEEHAKTGKKVDILAEANKLGMEVEEVEDLTQAYRCLVSKSRKSSEPVRRSEMSLSGELFDLVRRRAESWLALTEETYEASKKLKQFDRFDDIWQSAREEYDDARALLKEGLVAAAYWKARTAYMNSRTVLLSSVVADRLSGGDPVEALKIFSTLEEGSQKKLDSVFQALAAANPTRVNQTVLLLDAYEAAISAIVSREFAKAQYGGILRRMKEALKKGEDISTLISLFAEIYRPLREIALVEVDSQRALDNIALMEAHAVSHKTGLHRIDEVARLFQGAASANIEYFDSIFVREVADRAKKSQETVSAALMDNEPNYRTAQFNLKLPDSGKMGYAATGLPSSLAKLAGAISSFFASSTLVAKFYSIGVKLDNNGNTVGVEREKALISTLALAEEKARKNATLARTYAGEIPPSAKISYQIAMVLRERAGYPEKLEALEYFWRSSVWSQVAVYLARLEKEQKQ